MIRRIYVEKKRGFDVEAAELFRDLADNLGVGRIRGVRLFVRYDIEGLDSTGYDNAKNTIFSEPQVDIAYDEELPPLDSARNFAVEYLPGQYDQRADFAEQCLQMMLHGHKPSVRTGKVVAILGDISDEDFLRIKDYCINSIEAHEIGLDKPATLLDSYEPPKPIEALDWFNDCAPDEVIARLSLAMDRNDVLCCQDYFKCEGRAPTTTEIRVLDTYWSDHCRHTTFLTELTEVKIHDARIKEVYEEYLAHKDASKPICLMDVATGAMKRLKAAGALKNLDLSDEINACSIEIEADINGKKVPYLIMFKNETHNHPTEIEPYGGAATCLGGAIRDPLSGRAYVYQAMRVTGSGDPRKKVSDTLPGKLPQRKITVGAAKGFSSYGNQIGLATGQVAEIYDAGYIAKRMEIGAVIAAAPKENVVRQKPSAGDVVILLGGRTGRDGCGGATGSSKAHDEQSLAVCGAEVQKGNPPEERKIERLFRKKEVTTLIKRCNDFGAGGVSVAIGELADGLLINLDAVPKKYAGLDGTELAISESQERMAVVVASENAQKFISLAEQENLEATVVAEVTESPRLVMRYGGENIVDLSREFLDTNGSSKKAQVEIGEARVDFKQKDVGLLAALANLNMCSQRGLVERFDSSIGAASVLMPFGGTAQKTPSQAMAAKIPVLSGETNTATIMSYGFDVDLANQSPFHSAVCAVIAATSKIVASGGDFAQIYYTFQEYFEKLGSDSRRWGKPLAALLGAYYAQMRLGRAAIGGKDSMSGSFMDIDVPPTLVAFAVCPADAGKIVSNEFKQAQSRVILVKPLYDKSNLPDFEDLKKKYQKIHELISEGKILSAQALRGCLYETALMCFGNNVGIEFEAEADLFTPACGAIVLETTEDIGIGESVAFTTALPEIVYGNERVSLNDALDAWEGTLEGVFPSKTDEVHEVISSYSARNTKRPACKFAKPTVFIPVFPGTNCEYDTARAFEKAGANVEMFVIKNIKNSDIAFSIEQLAAHINRSQILALPGGFSAGDEPDGSGKFIVAAFRNKVVAEAIESLMQKRDGLILGICNGFQALIKLGLVPYGEIRSMTETCPTLTYNTIGRHVSRMAKTQVISTLSPWLAYQEVGNTHMIPISHGEGRFIAAAETISELEKNGQIATQYVGENLNGSMFGIEGITSPDGRIFGKMGHSERLGDNVAKNVPGEKDQMLFKAGADYFK